MVVDWITKTSTSEGKHGIQWTAWMHLDGWNFSDGLALLFHKDQQMQVKIFSDAAISASIGLNLHIGKSNILKYNAENTNSITLDGDAQKNVESSTCIGSIIDEQRRSVVDVQAMISKVKAVFLQLKNI
ncbi:unnamed protein product [Schistosoma margrebowiei]|uniref:Uncharacterized protein n=1 Tax=Schistosoma margrebowiei TaxID=48269 RepID=A0A183MZF1_9TREM|nr:unnamed protein product [Schistosoma margrebowiei]